MSSSIQKNKFTQSILALIFFVMLCAPISISKVSVTHLLSVSRTGGVFSENSILGPALAQAQTPPAANPPQAVTPKVDSSGSEWFTKIMMALGTLVLGIGAFFAWVTGKILDYSLQSLVFGMGDLINTGGVGVAIDAAWKIIRDFCNLAFIFGFIYLGIRTIIDPDNSSVKRTLSQIIMGALLINFSLYIAKFIIDFSNFTAYSIYNALVTGTGSISGLMFHMLGVTSFYSKGVLDTQQFAHVTGGGMFAFYIMGLILLLVAAFIFISAAILIVIRFVALVFLMIASPVLFAGFVFPQTASTTKMLWGKLFSYSFFAPLYLLLTLISLMVMKSFTTVMSGGNKLSGTLSNSSAQLDAFGVVVSFIVVIFFLTNSLLIAKKLSIAGGDTAISLGNSARKWGQVKVGNSTAGLAAATMRATAGQYAYNKSQDSSLRDRAATSWVARQKLKLATKVGDSSFDARNINGAGKAMGIGEGRSGGYKSVRDEINKKEEAFGRSLGEVDDKDVRVQARRREMQAKEREVRDLEEDLRGIPNDGTAASNDARRAKRQEIEDKKREIQDSKILYEKEKQRRIIGSTFAEPTEKIDQARKENYERDLKTQKDDLKKLWEGGTLSDGTNVQYGYSDKNMTEANRTLRRAQIKKHQEKLEAMEKELYKHLNATVADRGYAGTLEKSDRKRSWPTGRLATQDHEAGKEMRKNAEKGLPKKKDD